MHLGAVAFGEGTVGSGPSRQREFRDISEVRQSQISAGGEWMTGRKHRYLAFSVKVLGIETCCVVIWSVK